VFPYANLPGIYSFCRTRLEASQREGDADAPGLRGRLEIAVHALRALGPETWGQAEDDIREIAARFATHPEYTTLGFGRDE
jgi:hypothetical protein